MAAFVVSSGETSSGIILNSGATIDVTGYQAELDFVGNNTFDNATIDLGNAAGAFINSVDLGGGAILTFGSGAVVNHIAGNGDLFGDGIVNSGTINAVAPGGN